MKIDSKLLSKDVILNSSDEEEYILFEEKGIKVVTTFRLIDAKNAEDMKKVCEMADIPFDRLTYSKQIHSSTVRKIEKGDEGVVEDADAMITDVKGLPLAIFTADCVPVVFIDTVRKAVGIAHCGWRGTYGNIAGRTIGLMEKEYGSKPADIKVYIGPSIGPCCFEVGDDLYCRFRELIGNLENRYEFSSCYEKHNDRYHLDLWRINEIMALNAGVKEKNIHHFSVCTSCSNERFYSYRKDEKTEKRIGTIVCI